MPLSSKMQDEIKTGILLVQKGGGLVKKAHKRWAALYKRSPHGVSRLELYDTRENFEKRLKGAKKHLINLESCATITRNISPEGKKNEYAILLTFNGSKEQNFQTESEEDLQSWYDALSDVIFGGGADLCDNVIYQQYDDEGYEVTIKENEVVNRLELRGDYILCISNEDLELKDKISKQVVARWPLQLLRKYGRDKQEFSLEAGRRCPTGPGMFYFITDHYNAIFQVVDNKVRNLAERGRAHSTSSLKAVSSPTFPSSNPPDSPNLLQAPPSPMATSPKSQFSDFQIYDNPLDMKKVGSPEEESIYNEPANTKPTRKQRPPTKPSPKSKKPEISLKPTQNGKGNAVSSKQGPGKPQKKWGAFSGGGKMEGKIGKNNSATILPPPPEEPEDNMYAEALPVSGVVESNENAYGQLNFEGSGAASNGTEGDYDSLDVQWTAGKNKIVSTSEDSEYATAGDIHSRFQGISVEEESMYDKVKR